MAKSIMIFATGCHSETLCQLNLLELLPWPQESFAKTYLGKTVHAVINCTKHVAVAT